MFAVTKDSLAAMLAEEPSLGTLENQFTLDEIWDKLEGKDQIEDEEALYNALMDVMYATRPVGHL